MQDIDSPHTRHTHAKKRKARSRSTLSMINKITNNLQDSTKYEKQLQRIRSYTHRNQHLLYYRYYDFIFLFLLWASLVLLLISIIYGIVSNSIYLSVDGIPNSGHSKESTYRSCIQGLELVMTIKIQHKSWTTCLPVCFCVVSTVSWPDPEARAFHSSLCSPHSSSQVAPSADELSMFPSHSHTQFHQESRPFSGQSANPTVKNVSSP